MKYPLPSGWTLNPVGDTALVPDAVRRPVPATVPGCVHTDLLAAGLIPDPYLDMNENDLGWIGRTDWAYETSFGVSAEQLSYEHLELVCEGLDTVARLELNGRFVAETKNMHRSYRFDARPFVRMGENTLRVTFTAPMTYSEGVRDEVGDLPNAYIGAPFNFIRKMASNFGWDWGPVLTTAGVWQPLYLEAWNVTRLGSVRPLVELNDDLSAAVVSVHADLVAAAPDLGTVNDLTLTARLSFAGDVVAETSQPLGDSQSVVNLDVADPKLWWPVGHGDQPLYDLEVGLEHTGTVLDTFSSRIGLRKTELDTAVDSAGSAFTLKINDKPIFIKGANWIPDDAFVTRIGKERYAERIEQALDANLNMLRVWGGGIYEQRDFYNLCDERGVLVWQDFLFACAAYPEQEPFRSEVEAEARYQVARLSRHASLVLWNGNNENIWGYYDWDWQERLAGRSWGAGYYLELLPGIVAELDPTRPYWPGSPYSGTLEIYPNADAHGNKHIWDVWNQKDYTVYRAYVPRFVSEFGHQAPPTYATITESLTERPLKPDSPGMLHHQKAVDGNDKLGARLVEHFDVPEDFGAWLYATQLNQARALELGVTHFRSYAPLCMGTLYWQLNDCWPVTSWAAIDGYGRKKSLWYATKRFYADRLLTFQPRGDKLMLFACNDSDDAWSDEVSVRRMGFAGDVYAAKTLQLEVTARSTQMVLELPTNLAQAADSKRELLVADTQNERALWFFGRDKDLAYPEAAFEATLATVGDSLELTVYAKTLLRDVAVFVDRLDPDAVVSDQLVTLLPGESFTFEMTGLGATHDQLTTPPVFRCANQLRAVVPVGAD